MTPKDIWVASLRNETEAEKLVFLSVNKARLDVCPHQRFETGRLVNQVRQVPSEARVVFLSCLSVINDATVTLHSE